MVRRSVGALGNSRRRARFALALTAAAMLSACRTPGSAVLSAAAGAELAGLPFSGALTEIGAGSYDFRATTGRATLSMEHWVTDPALQVLPAAASPGGLDGRTIPDFWRERFRPLFVKRLALANGGARFLISLRNGGLIFSDDSGRTWQRSAGLPCRFVPEDYGGPVLFRDVEDVWQNPRRPAHLLAVVKHRLLESQDAGASFRGLPDTGIRANFTAIVGRVDALGNLTDLFVGTSVTGVYRIYMSGGAYRKSGYRHCFRGLPYERHDNRNWLFDEVVGLAVDETSGSLLVAFRFAGGLFRSAIPSSRTELTFSPGGPELPKGEAIHSLALISGRVVLGGSHALYVHEPRAGEPRAVQTRPGVEGWRSVPASVAYGTQRRFAGLFFAGQGRISVQLFFPQKTHVYPDQVRAVYVSPTTVNSRQKQLFKLLDDYPFNAAVIDVKDDFGRLVYGSKLPEAAAMGNQRERAPIRNLLPKLKARRIHLIARIVVFKDSRLYSYDRGRYALVDRGTGAPWQGAEVERWVDSYSTFVQNYNIRVAREVLALGFDEVQFDYIRFPSDGPVHRIRWRHRKGDAYKSEALEAFLRKARQNIAAPISVDIYGYNGMYRVSGLVGQDLLDIGDYVDVVSPMHYSSHYGPLYLESVPRARRTFTLLQLGTDRPRLMGAGRFAVRPWVQCFQLLSGRWGWGPQYMRDQIEGVRAGGGNGVLWWGPLRLFYLPGRVHKDLGAGTAGR